ncbi:hypothetical protein K440DRAFT_664706 [Wilcoxina mikolae CBS 423.85]|nr:hypothetical protein K440DRAFT_664706 [Wilcoxina mikolae CBS 423.85]
MTILPEEKIVYHCELRIDAQMGLSELRNPSSDILQATETPKDLQIADALALFMVTRSVGDVATVSLQLSPDQVGRYEHFTTKFETSNSDQLHPTFNLIVDEEGRTIMDGTHGVTLNDEIRPVHKRCCSGFTKRFFTFPLYFLEFRITTELSIIMTTLKSKSFLGGESASAVVVYVHTPYNPTTYSEQNGVHRVDVYPITQVSTSSPSHIYPQRIQPNQYRERRKLVLPPAIPDTASFLLVRSLTARVDQLLHGVLDTKSQSPEAASLFTAAVVDSTWYIRNPALILLIVIIADTVSVVYRVNSTKGGGGVGKEG